MKTLHRQFLGSLLWSLALTTSLALADALERGFLNPPPTARPWVFWIWLDCDSSPAAITRDLEEMKAKGIVGCMLYDTGAGKITHTDRNMILEGKEYRLVPTSEYKSAYTAPLPTPPMSAWTPRWRELVRFSAREAARLQLDLCLSAGLADTSGPIEPEYGKQVLTWTEVSVTGPQTYDATLPTKTVDGLNAKNSIRDLNKALYYREVAVRTI